LAKAYKGFIILFFLAISAVVLLEPHSAKDFSARLSMLPKGAAPLNGRIFVKGDKVRQETSGPGGVQLMICRPDLKVTWMITDAGRVCLQMPYRPSDNDVDQWLSLKSTAPRSLGAETVCGLSCRKYQGEENGNPTLFWISERFSFPVKIDNQDKTIEYTNVKQCRLADSLFEIPAACKKATTTIAPP
jgi:hypothetical protein